MPRFELRQDAAHHRYWGVWDRTTGTWHTGQYDTAGYFAGVPLWDRRQIAQSVVDSLNADELVDDDARAFARDTLGPQATDEEVENLATLRAERDSKEV